jgi:hypothetical protein
MGDEIGIAQRMWRYPSPPDFKGPTLIYARVGLIPVFTAPAM